MKTQRLPKQLVTMILALLVLVMVSGIAHAATLFTDEGSASLGRGTPLTLTLTAQRRPAEADASIRYRIRLYNANNQVIPIDNKTYYDITAELSRFSSTNRDGYQTASAKFTMNTDTLALGNYRLMLYIYIGDIRKDADPEKYENYRFTITNHQHTWNQGVQTKAPTCTKTGIMTYTCTTCGATKTQVIKALGHDYDDGVVTRKPTWGKEGIKTYTCSRCGYKKIEKIPASGGPKKGTKFSQGSVVYQVRKKGKEVILVEDTNPKKAVVIPDTITEQDLKYKVTAIGSGAYKEENITSLTTGKYITKISFEAFRNCKKLKKVTLTGSKSLTFIGVNCFMGCSQVKGVTIPASVKIISTNAFRGCSKLARINVKTTKLTSAGFGRNVFTGTPQSVTVNVPKKKLKTYKKWLTASGISEKATITGKY